MVKIVCWNVNGLRAILKKDKQGKRDTEQPNVLESLISEHEPDIVCLNETKCPEDIDPNLPYSFKKIYASRTKKGYSGVAVFSNMEPLNVLEDFPENEEGRVLCLEYPEFYLVNCYTPNSKPDLSRLSYRVNTWDRTMKEYISKLQKKKPVIYTGDMNVAPTAMDIHTEKGHLRSHGYTIEERNAFFELLKECEMIDCFRYLHPTTRKYSWWSNFAKSRENNKGWRIDQFLVTKKLTKNIKTADILTDYYGSDHAPIILDIDIYSQRKL